MGLAMQRKPLPPAKVSGTVSTLPDRFTTIKALTDPAAELGG